MNEIKIGDLVIYDDTLRWMGLVICACDSGSLHPGEWEVHWFKYPADYKERVTYHCDAEIRGWRNRARKFK